MKKILNIVKILLIIIIITFAFFIIDNAKSKNNKSPIFCIKIQVEEDNGSTIYIGLGYKIIRYHNIQNNNEVYAIGSWFLKYNNPYANALEIETPLPTVYSYFENVNEGIALCVGDQAMGTYALQTYITKDGGENWTLALESEDRFIAVSINASYIFMNNKVGFISSPANGGNNSYLMMTANGGKTFETISFVDDGVIETSDNGNQLKKNDIYDYYELPSYKDGILTVIVSQGSDGDYKGGKTALEYQSLDMGDTWKFMREIK